MRTKIRHFFNKTPGFTLIELLVVIAIIGLLASVVLVALNGARIKSRDAKRLADIAQIQKALELYYDSNNNQYPNLCGAASSGSSGPGWPNLASQLSKYLGKLPNDPKNTAAQYGYYYCSRYKPNGNCSFTNTGLVNNYILATRLESASASPNSCPTTFGGWDNSFLNYIVGSGQ